MKEHDTVQADTRKIVGKHLREFGISPQAEGYHYLKESIALMVEDSRMEVVNTNLYPKLIEIFSKKASSMEYAMRYVIEESYSKGWRDEITRKYFGNTLNHRENRPAILEFMLAIKAQIIQEDVKRKEAGRHLRIIGVPMTSDGFEYLKAAIAITIEYGENVDHNMEELYARVAKDFETTVNSVERAMRYVIELTFNRRWDSETVRKYFGNSLNKENRPTNSEFIMAVKEQMMEQSQDLKQAGRHLRLLGVSMNQKGYLYLKKSIALAVEDPLLVEAESPQVLYQMVSEELGTTAKKAEKAMRKAIQSAYDNPNNKTMMQKYYGRKLKSRPRTLVFVEKIRAKIVKGV